MGKSLLDDIVSQHQWSIGMCLFFLETMKLTFFLLGSNTAKEEIVVNRCCVSLVRGEEKENVVLVQKQDIMVVKDMILPSLKTTPNCPSQAQK